MVFYNFCY